MNSSVDVEKKITISFIDISNYFIHNWLIPELIKTVVIDKLSIELINLDVNDFQQAPKHCLFSTTSK
jgi:hypothetical protein